MPVTHKPAKTISDKIAFGLVKFFRFFADTFEAGAYRQYKKQGITGALITA